jgi:hypothetical protein
MPSIRADKLAYDKLIESDKIDTASMVKKADELMRTHSNRMHIADNALGTAHTMLTPNEFTAALIRNGIHAPAMGNPGL